VDVAPVGEPPPESILPRRIATLSLGQVAERAGTLDADGAGASSDARAAGLLGRPRRRRLAPTICARAETVVVWSSLHHHWPAPPSPPHPK